jgi:RND family efflux transporter MFP subunit
VESLPATKALEVRSQGSVQPHTETELVAEVAGRVTWVSPSFVVGGFVSEGEELLRLDERDYAVQLAAAEAQLAQARVRQAREEAEAEVALSEWSDLGKGEPGPLVRREPQLAGARADVQAALAGVAKAELDVERTTIRSPFRGRLRQKMADMGQFVNRGGVLGRLYAVDYAEVRLPVPNEDLGFLDVSLRASRGGDGARVWLSANFAGEDAVWEGRIVRTEGEIDPRSRMVHLVARVDDPYAPAGEDEPRPPLAVGLFVEARIEGRSIDGLIELPRVALRGDSMVLVVGDDSRVSEREVEVLRRGEDSILVSSGLRRGERVCVSPLDAYVEGMEVRILEDPASAAVLATGGQS